MNKQIIVFLLIVCLLCISGCMSKVQETDVEVNEKIISTKNYEALLNYKDSYVGDNTAVSQIANLLANGSFVQKLSLDTQGENYGATIYYNTKVDQDHIWKGEDTEKILLYNGTMMFALIKNVDVIHFEIIGSYEETYKLTRDDVEKTYDVDLKDLINDRDVWVNKLINPIIEGRYVLPVSEAIDNELESSADLSELAPNLKYEYKEIEHDERIEKSVNEAFYRITSDFDITFEDKITLIVYRNQPAFWESVFDRPNNGRTTGFADVENNIIHITSPTDTHIKDEEAMLKVPIHELVHILLPHAYLDIREGTAYYLAGQTKTFTKADIPSNLSSIITYEGGADQISMTYNLAGYKVKFMVEECLEMNCKKYKAFMENPEDYTILGYENENAFLEDFKSYLLENIM